MVQGLIGRQDGAGIQGLTGWQGISIKNNGVVVRNTVTELSWIREIIFRPRVKIYLSCVHIYGFAQTHVEQDELTLHQWQSYAISKKKHVPVIFNLMYAWQLKKLVTKLFKTVRLWSQSWMDYWTGIPGTGPGSQGVQGLQNSSNETKRTSINDLTESRLCLWEFWFSCKMLLRRFYMSAAS